MTIEQIDGERILIALCDEDMKSFSLEFESMTLSDPNVREALKNLVSFASLQTGLSIKDKKMIVEAIPYNKGCLLMITLKQKRRERKIYKIKGARPLIFSFDEIEDVLRCVIELYKIRARRISSSVYKFGGRYILAIIPHGMLPVRYTTILGEFGTRITGGGLKLSKIREYGAVVAENNAVEIIGASLMKANDKSS